MNKNELYRIISLMMSLYVNNEEYSDYLDIINDEKVNDCLTKVYFSMLSKDKEVSDKFYNEFEEKYKELNDEQKEIIKIEISKILDIEYKPKIKKKER